MMKDPDTLDDAIDDAVAKSVEEFTDEQEREAIAQVRREKVRDVARRWFEYGEYLQVEIDTEANTCTVIEVGK